MADIVWNDAVLAEFLAAADKAVLAELTPKVEALAFELAPVGVRRVPVPSFVHHPTHGHGGHLKASVHSEISQDSEGDYGDVIALWYGRFMDPKARQLHYKRPFLPTALYTVCQGRVLYLD
jgi:hypothetical protein